MSDTWFTSDHHWGHKNILLYEPIARPFATIEEMNEVMVDKWNSVVGKYDKVYHLGDFCMGGKANVAIAGRLNGNKRLIMGNHDAYPAEEYLKYFKSVHGVLFWNKFICTHVPIHPDCLPNRAIGNLHGHLHSKSIYWDIQVYDYWESDGDPRYFNCSIEQHGLAPVNADIILEHFKQFDTDVRLHTS